MNLESRHQYSKIQPGKPTQADRYQPISRQSPCHLDSHQSTKLPAIIFKSVFVRVSMIYSHNLLQTGMHNLIAPFNMLSNFCPWFVCIGFVLYYDPIGICQTFSQIFKASFAIYEDKFSTYVSLAYLKVFTKRNNSVIAGTEFRAHINVTYQTVVCWEFKVWYIITSLVYCLRLHFLCKPQGLHWKRQFSDH